MKSLTLSIPNPCHEDWNNMTPTQRGAYCGSCCKEVMDFTTWTDRELIEYLSKAGSVCGRVRNDQLRTFGISTTQQNRVRWWVGVAFVVGMFFSSSVSAQQERKVTEQVGNNTIDNRFEELKQWSAERSATRSAIESSNQPNVVYGLTGRMGGLVVSVPVVERVKFWFWDVYDMLRQ